MTSTGIVKDGTIQQTPTRTDTNPVPPSTVPTNLLPPLLNKGQAVTGATTHLLRKENKQLRHNAQLTQSEHQDLWKEHHGTFALPPNLPPVANHRNNMCPAGLALHHPAADLLKMYATLGCPTETGLPWTLKQMQAAIDRGPHISTLEPAAAEQLRLEVAEKVNNGQARIVNWDDIKDNPPPQLKISPVAMIPHKSRAYRAILDLSFPVRLQDGSLVPSVNDNTTKTAPRGAITQIGHSLKRIIHAFAAAGENDKIFMAKWDIKDGFWRLDCQSGEEWNFAYVLPPLTPNDKQVQLVIPTSLQMGWIESPPYFCAASETARDVAENYLQLPIGELDDHKFLPWSDLTSSYADLPLECRGKLRYLLEVYMDDYIGLAIPTSQQQLQHYSARRR